MSKESKCNELLRKTLKKIDASYGILIFFEGKEKLEGYGFSIEVDSSILKIIPEILKEIIIEIEEKNKELFGDENNDE